MLGAITGEPAILEPLSRGEDLHEKQALGMFGEVARGKAEPYRTFTKRFKFRLYYGGDPAQCGDIPGAQQLRLDRGKLNALGKKFLAGLPVYQEWRERVKAALVNHPRPESRDFLGRRRRFLSSKGMAVIREAWNNPLQMGVASVLNLTLVTLHQAAPWSLFVYTMHDAATVECPADRAEKLQAIAQPIVQRAWPIADQFGVVRDIVFKAEFKEIIYGT
jgi:DNA polymerase I-like protein with 3'-5' exonuclease and polymerase domains